MKLRLMVELDAGADLIEQIREYVAEQRGVGVDPCDGLGAMRGTLVGAVPVDSEPARVFADGPDVLRAIGGED